MAVSNAELAMLQREGALTRDNYLALTRGQSKPSDIKLSSNSGYASSLGDYNNLLASKGYTGSNMGDSFWNDPTVLSAYRKAAASYKGARHDKGFSGGQPVYGDINKGSFLQEIAPMLAAFAVPFAGAGIFGTGGLLGAAGAGEAAASTGGSALDSVLGGIGDFISSPIKSIGSGLQSIYDVLPSFSGSAPSGAAHGALDSLMADAGYGASSIPSGGLPSLTGASSAVDSAQGILGSVLSKIKSNPLGALGSAVTVGNALQGGKVAGTQSQDQILSQMQQKQAQDARFSQQVINQLNNATSGRKPVPPSITDYYTYGTRPEAMFFDKVNTPITY